MSEIPETIVDYYKEKARDLPKPSRGSALGVSLNKLDGLVRESLRIGDAITRLGREQLDLQAQISAAIKEISDSKDNSYTEEVLRYRIRQLFYK